MVNGYSHAHSDSLIAPNRLYEYPKPLENPHCTALCLSVGFGSTPEFPSPTPWNGLVLARSYNQDFARAKLNSSSLHSQNENHQLF